MQAIFITMIRQIFKLNASMLALAVATGAVLYKIGWTELALFIGLMLFATFLLGPTETSRKLPLMLSFPYSRNRLLLLTGITNLIGAFFSGISISIYSWIAYSYWQDKETEFSLGQRIGNGLSSFSSLVQALIEILNNPRKLAMVLIAFSLLSLFFFLTINSQNWAKRQQSVFNQQGQKAHWLQAMKAYSVIVIVFLLGYYSDFIMISLIMIGLNLFSAGIVSNSWAFSPARARKWLLFSFIAGIIQTLILLSCTLNSVYSGSPKRRIQSVELLGFIGPRVGADFIRKVVSKPIHDDEAERLVKLIGPKKLHDQYDAYTWHAEKALLGFREMIANQNDYDALLWLLSLYDPRSLNEADLNYLVSRNELNKKIDVEWKRIPIHTLWIAIPMSDKFILDFLHAKDDFKISFALDYMQFHPSVNFLEPLKQKLRTDLPGRLIPEGVLALSILQGEMLNLRSYLEAIRVESNANFKKIDCSQVNLQYLLDLKEEKESPLFNRCIREFAVKNGNPGTIAEFTSWFTLPLNTSDKKTLTKAFSRN